MASKKFKPRPHPEPVAHDPNYVGPTWYAMEALVDGKWYRYRNQFDIFPSVVGSLRILGVEWPHMPSDVRVVHVSARYPELFRVITLNSAGVPPMVGA